MQYSSWNVWQKWYLEGVQRRDAQVMESQLEKPLYRRETSSRMLLNRLRRGGGRTLVVWGFFGYQTSLSSSIHVVYRFPGRETHSRCDSSSQGVDDFVKLHGTPRLLLMLNHSSYEHYDITWVFFLTEYTLVGKSNSDTSSQCCLPLLQSRNFLHLTIAGHSQGASLWDMLCGLLL